MIPYYIRFSRRAGIKCLQEILKTDGAAHARAVGSRMSLTAYTQQDLDIMHQWEQWDKKWYRRHNLLSWMPSYSQIILAIRRDS